MITYNCESWSIEKAECRIIDAFELWCWRRLFRVPWTARSNQSVLKEINAEYSLEGLMLKLQYFGHLMWTVDSLEKTLDAGKDWGQKKVSENEMAGWHHWCNGHEFGQTLGDGVGQGGLARCSSWGGKESDRTGQLNNSKSRALRPQGWVSSGQTTNREGAQPHPSAVNRIKDLQSKALPTRARQKNHSSQGLKQKPH